VRRENGKSARNGAPEIAGGIAVTAWKSGTTQLQYLLSVGGRHASCQQRACDPQIHDAPVRLWKALRDVPAPHPALIDLDGLCRARARGSSRLFRRWGGGREIESVAALADVGASVLQEALGMARQSGSGMHHFHPWRAAVRIAAVRLLIGETGQPAQVPPIGAGNVAPIEARQMPTHGGSQSRLHRGSADVDPSLPVTGTGLEHGARLMAVSAHGSYRRGIRFIQVDQDVAGIVVPGIRVDVHVASLTVAPAQKADDSEGCQLSGGPEPFSGKRPLGRIMDQANEVKITRYGCQLAADGLYGERKARVEHAPILQCMGGVVQ
jgi:hypothetical protein